MLEHVPAIIPPKPSKFKMPKALKILNPKINNMSDEDKVNIDPFILKHRVGTTERITSMDPMSEEFIRSLRIAYRGKFTGKAITSANELIPAQVLISLTVRRMSKLFQSVVPDYVSITPANLGELGRPWAETGWIEPSFLVATGFLTQKTTGTVPFATAKVSMETWRYHKPDTACSTGYDGLPVLATLVNTFEAVKDSLICYSFIVKYQMPERPPGEGNQALVHIWVNRTYLEQRLRKLPMYFEHAGSFAFIINAATACLGLELTPAGEVYLTVDSKSGPKKTLLNMAQVQGLITDGVLADFRAVATSSAIPWGQMTNADWQGLGYDLQTNGVMWNLSSQTTHLPWQVQEQRSRVMTNYPTIKRMAGTVGKTLGGIREIFELKSSLRKAAISKSIGSTYWAAVLTSNNSLYDKIIFDLRTDFIAGELVDEVKRLRGEVSGKELFNMTWNSSDQLGRFVFERNLPSASQPEIVAEAVEARPSID